MVSRLVCYIMVGGIHVIFTAILWRKSFICDISGVDGAIPTLVEKAREKGVLAMSQV